MAHVITPASSLSALISQVAGSPETVAAKTPDAVNPFLNPNDNSSLNLSGGFAGVRKEVADDGYVGSGLNLELELSSGQSIELDIQQTISGAVRHVSLNTKGELSVVDQERFQDFLGKLGDSIDQLFSGQGGNEGLFDFANASGIKDIELNVQQQNGNTKQRLEFEKQYQVNGRKEIEAQWFRHDLKTGSQEQHNLALSKQAREAAASYGQNDYQWVVDQVQAGMGILGNAHTGNSSIQSRVSDFFISGVHSLFNEVQKGKEILNNMGANIEDAQKLLGRTVQALSAKASGEYISKNSDPNNMPGQAVATGNNQQSAQGSGVNGLPDFKAHFASKKENNGNANANGSYNLSMEVSQTSNLIADIDDETSTQTQFRRLLLEYESQGNKQKYDYKWQHNEAAIDRYNKGALESGYFKIEDLQQGILTNGDGVRDETSSYMSRTQYSAEDRDKPALQNSYINPHTYVERGGNVNYTA